MGDKQGATNPSRRGVLRSVDCTTMTIGFDTMNVLFGNPIYTLTRLAKNNDTLHTH